MESRRNDLNIKIGNALNRFECLNKLARANVEKSIEPVLYEDEIDIIIKALNIAYEHTRRLEPMGKDDWTECSLRMPETKAVIVADKTYTCSEIVWISLEGEVMMQAYLEDGRWYSIGGELIKEKVVAWHPAYKPAKYKLGR